MKRWWIWAAVCLLLVAVTVGTVLGIRGANAREPVVVCGDYEMDSTELAYYYWSEFFYFSEAYGEYLAGTVDFSKPLSEQTYDADRSWEDYLLEQTLQTVRDSLSLVFRAEEEGFSLPEDYAGTYQQVLVNFSAAAQESGYADLEAYLRASYGKHADRESFERYLYHSHLAAAYSDHLLAQCAPTDADCRAYFEAHQADYVSWYDAVPEDETTWMEQVRQDLQQEAYQNAFLTICKDYEFLVRDDGIVLTPPQGLYE